MTEDPLDNSAVRNAILRLAPSLALLMILPILYFSTKILNAIGNENIELATAYGGILSGLGTIGIFILTAWYATETRRMVSETKKGREQERKIKKEEQKNELNSLRRALLKEISQLRYFDEFAKKKYNAGASVLSFVAPTTVYEENAEKIGLLTEKEVDLIVEFYTRVYQIEDLMRVQQERDTSIGKDAITRYFKGIEQYCDKWLQKVTFGRITPKNKNQRTEGIRSRLDKIDTVQQEAIEALEKAIEDSSE